MSEYKIGRPSQDIRLRNWPAGRVAALKLMVTRLEEALNDTLGAQVEQSIERLLNDQIPFIIVLSIAAILDFS